MSIFISAGHNSKSKNIKQDPGAVNKQGIKEGDLTIEFRDLVCQELDLLNANYIKDLDEESLSMYLNRVKTGTGRWAFVFKDTLALEFYFQSSSGFNDLISTNNVLVLNKWQYITVVLNRTTGVKLYVDNVEVGSLNINTSGENLTVNRPFHIGLHSDNLVASGARFEMNYYTHYNRALSRDELTYNYNTTKQFMKV